MSHFFAYLARMKYIKRWGLMRNTSEENIMEHSLQVTMIAHNLGLVCNKIYGGNVDIEKLLLLSLYHETSEIITGDLATPIKYYNPEIKETYKNIEKIANERIHSMIPVEFQSDYKFIIENEDCYEQRLVKAADKISAYLKCLEELKMGNSEFIKAKDAVYQEIIKLDLKEAIYWLDTYANSFDLTIDELN